MRLPSEKYNISLSSQIRHILHCCLLIAMLIIIEVSIGGIKLGTTQTDSVNVDPFQIYGVVCTIILYVLRFIPLLVLPSSVLNFMGLIFYNAFPGKIELKNSPTLAPFICIRTVTRGDFPELVKNNVSRNINTCLDVGLKNFIVEVVTEKAIKIPKHPLIREIVVPSNYSTKRGALFKARALQYCLEDGVNTLSDNAWIVHLDEETLLTEDSVNGILNFIADGKCQFGQGVITYANENVVNWMTTLADSYRVGIDMGCLRCQFKMFHKPILPWKGSFMVVQVCAERNVSFDFGPEGSIGEDGFMCMLASLHGYKFDFVEGEMWEKSAFTLLDFIQQRKRWAQGLFLLVFCKIIPFRVKIVLSMVFCAWVTLPLSLLNILLTNLFPIPSWQILNFVNGFVTAMTIYIYYFGAIKSLNFKRLGYFKYTLCVFGAGCGFLLNLIVETIAIVWGILSSKNNFYVVNKEVLPRFGSRITAV